MTPFAVQRLDVHFATQAFADHKRTVAYLAALPEAPYRAKMRGKPLSGLGRNPKHDVINFMFDDEGHPQWTCHALARAVKNHAGLTLPWKVIDGWYATIGKNHSWLLFEPGHTKDKRQRRLILDVYPIAHLTEAILVDASYGTPTNRLYIAPTYTEAHQATFEAEAQIAAQLHPFTKKQ